MTSIAEPVRADAAFGTDLYAQLAGPGSLVFSPASIAAALRMALVGARGDTAAELAAALHLPGPEAAADGLGQLAAIRGRRRPHLPRAQRDVAGGVRPRAGRVPAPAGRHGLRRAL